MVAGIVVNDVDVRGSGSVSLTCASVVLAEGSSVAVSVVVCESETVVDAAVVHLVAVVVVVAVAIRLRDTPLALSCPPHETLGTVQLSEQCGYPA